MIMQINLHGTFKPRERRTLRVQVKYVFRPEKIVIDSGIVECFKGISTVLPSTTPTLKQGEVFRLDVENITDEAQQFSALVIGHGVV